jgi:hypothetical protein
MDSSSIYVIAVVIDIVVIQRLLHDIRNQLSISMQKGEYTGGIEGAQKKKKKNRTGVVTLLRTNSAYRQQTKNPRR